MEVEVRKVRAFDQDTLLSNVDGQIYATSNRCRHENASLARGTLQGKVATCPLHRAFSLYANFGFEPARRWTPPGSPTQSFPEGLGGELWELCENSVFGLSKYEKICKVSRGWAGGCSYYTSAFSRGLAVSRG